MLRMADQIDVIVPRGGRSLIERVYAESRIPVLAHLEGNCHTYLHASAEPDMAVEITLNAKLRRTGVCGATETLLVDRAAAERLLPPVLGALMDAAARSVATPPCAALEPRATPASEDGLGDRVPGGDPGGARPWTGSTRPSRHVNAYGSHHTDSIVAEDAAAAERFLREVDSAIVLHNASTQFADGGEFGMGAEIGIATGRLHARGPVGVEQLTSYKYMVRGSGQIRPGLTPLTALCDRRRRCAGRCCVCCARRDGAESLAPIRPLAGGLARGLVQPGARGPPLHQPRRR